MVTVRSGSRKRPEGGIDALGVVFDDDNALANAGLVLPATLAGRLGLERLVDETLDLGLRPGAFSPGRKVMSLVHSILAGGDSIDAADVLRCGSSQAVLGHRVLAPSTLGTFLRSFTLGHVRQLDRVAELAMRRAWEAGAGPGSAPMTIDLDSSICAVHGYHTQGAAFGYTRVRGYHPLLATRAQTGELCHVRMRKGLRQHRPRRPALRARALRASAPRRRHGRADDPGRLGLLVGHGDRRLSPPRRALFDQRAPGSGRHGGDQGMRLVVRRTRLIEAQGELVPDWRHHAFVSDRDGDAIALDADHRRHAVIELAIRDLKEGSGLAHCPSGRFFANSAWLVIGALAHNLVRWVARIGLGVEGPVVAATIRRRFFSMPGRITRSGRRRMLHPPSAWPWAEPFTSAIRRLRAVSLQI